MDPLVNPVCEKDVAVLWVLETRVSYDSVPFFTSILYPVTAEPPLFVGGDHERLTCVGDAAVAVNPTGDPGMLEDEDGVVTEDSADAALVPT
jgi:hypothetical protein